jgi:hypothetical protein
MKQQNTMAATAAANLVQGIATKLYGDAGTGVNDLIALSNLVAAGPVRQMSEAATLRHAAAVLYMWEDDPNLTGYMSDFEDACAILELLAQHAPPARTIDVGQLRDLMGFGPCQAIQLPETDPRRDYIRHANGLVARIDKAVQS